MASRGELLHWVGRVVDMLGGPAVVGVHVEARKGVKDE